MFRLFQNEMKLITKIKKWQSSVKKGIQFMNRTIKKKKKTGFAICVSSGTCMIYSLLWFIKRFEYYACDWISVIQFRFHYFDMFLLNSSIFLSMLGICPSELYMNICWRHREKGDGQEIIREKVFLLSNCKQLKRIMMRRQRYLFSVWNHWNKDSLEVF